MAFKNIFRNVLSFFTKKEQKTAATDNQFRPKYETPKNNRPSPFKTNEVIKDKSFLPTSVSDATMVIYYKDETDQDLLRPQIISGTLGSDFRIKFELIDDYNLIGISGFTSTFVTSYGSIVLSYEKKHGATVWIYNQDVDGGNLLGQPTLLRGHLNEPFAYEPITIPGFNLLRASKTSYGNFTNEQQTIYYYYRNSNWKTVDQIDTYVQIKKRAHCYDLPDGHPYPAFLPALGIFQVFEKIETKSGTTWFGMGGNQWLADTSNVKFIDQPEYRLLPEYEIEPFTEKAINQTVSIDFIPNKSVTIYSEPYGQKLKMIPDDTQVVLIKQLSSATSSDWFELKDGGFINESYIKLPYSLN